MIERDREIGIYIDRTYKVVRQDLISRFKEKAINLTPEQWIILWNLHNKSKLTQTEIASLSFKDKPTVSRIIDLLVNKGFVEKVIDKSDKRKYTVNLTSSGNEEIKKALPIVQDSRMIGWKDLSESEYHELIRLLDKIFTNYKEK